MRTAIGIIAAVVIVVVGGIIAWPFLMGGPGKPAAGFLAALESKDLAAAREFLTPEGKGVSDERLAEVIGSGAVTVGAVSMSTDSFAQVAFTAGERSSQLLLQKVDGTWRVIGEASETFSGPPPDPRKEQKLTGEWEEVASQFLEAMIVGNVDEAAGLLTSKGQEAGKPMLEEWATSWASRRATGREFYGRIYGSSAEGDEQVVRAEFAYMGNMAPTDPNARGNEMAAASRARTAPQGPPGGGPGGGGGGGRGGPGGGGGRGGPGGFGQAGGASATPRYFRANTVDDSDRGQVEVRLRKEGESWRVRQTSSVPPTNLGQGRILDQEALKKATLVRDFENPPALESSPAGG